MNFPVCEIGQLVDNDAIGLDVPYGDRKIPLIVFSMNQHCMVFLNSCPHTGVRLDWRPDDFLDHSKTYFQCSMHAALFKTTDGMCVEGPCLGASLIQLDSFIEDEMLYLRAGQNIPETARQLKLAD